ncbi:glycosyltransferase family 4 protein [Pseudarthrobacter sulfonivorans]|uniref:glycosyltransferase family 4 protein n=1 Tax=Pseudarthrobacter sulfonivorans TaxID=121292 RepID=UPI00210416FF|nr:glycosyltransferase family 4 protein [Pseudarthrobacter sulfonivorans]
MTTPNRIGLLYPQRDPRFPGNWSGTPSGLAVGVEACGFEVVPIGVEIPWVVNAGVSLLSRSTGRTGPVADRMPVRQLARTVALSRALGKSGLLDGIIAMGTEMYNLDSVVRSSIPCATYDDGTLIQMWRNADSDIRGLKIPVRHLRRWFANQASSSRTADVCCVSTSWASRSFIEDYGIAPGRVRVVGMGHMPRGSARPVERDWTRPRFLFVGVDWRRKNGEAVLESFRRLRRQFPDATLDLVGQHPKVVEPGVRDHGFLPREDQAAQALLAGLFAAATAFVLPSRFDPSPIAYLEAASAGLPVIATTEGGAGELLGPAALTVHPDDSAALFGAMVQLCDSRTARLMGSEARVRAGASSWHDVAGRVLACLGIPDPTPSSTTAVK